MIAVPVTVVVVVHEVLAGQDLAADRVHVGGVAAASPSEPPIRTTWKALCVPSGAGTATAVACLVLAVARSMPPSLAAISSACCSVIPAAGAPRSNATGSR
ncbi:hypothetical protein ACFQX6_34755 [Streptosporangium lutulentum]